MTLPIAGPGRTHHPLQFRQPPKLRIPKEHVAGRCMGCGQIVNAGFMCDGCGREEDRERAGL